MKERNLYRLNQEQWTARQMMQLDTAIELGILIHVESTKLERKLRDTLNRICKLVPSVRRISELDRIAVELEAEADAYESLGVGVSPTIGGVDSDGLRADALYLRRLEYDLTSMREAKATVAKKEGGGAPMRASSKYETSQWPRGERP